MKKIGKILILCLVAVVIFLTAALSLNQKDEEKEYLQEAQEVSNQPINLGYGMRIVEIGAYAGEYVEDGSNEFTLDVLALVVKNEGEEYIQYAEITMPVGEENANFSVSTLTPGSTVVLLEKNRMIYEERDYTTATVQNVVIFQEPLSLCEDQLEVQILDGALNVKNISGKSIEDDITVYYKNYSSDIYYGGITYRVRVEGGLEKEEIRQIPVAHVSKSGSKLMFVTCGDK